MPNVPVSEPSSNAPRHRVTIDDVVSWEYELMEALRDARHYIDWGTGSVMDDEDPPPMVKYKIEAHGAITGAEEFIQKAFDALRDVLYERDGSHGERASPTGRHERAHGHALLAEVRKVENAAAQIRRLVDVLQPPRPRPGT